MFCCGCYVCRFGRIATLRNHVVADHGIADAVTERMTFASPAEVDAPFGQIKSNIHFHGALE